MHQTGYIYTFYLIQQTLCLQRDPLLHEDNHDLIGLNKKLKEPNFFSFST